MQLQELAVLQLYLLIHLLTSPNRFLCLALICGMELADLGNKLLDLLPQVGCLAVPDCFELLGLFLHLRYVSG